MRRSQLSLALAAATAVLLTALSPLGPAHVPLAHASSSVEISPVVGKTSDGLPNGAPTNYSYSQTRTSYQYQGGSVTLSTSANGSGPIVVDDAIRVTVYAADGRNWSRQWASYTQNLSASDMSDLFGEGPGPYTVQVNLIDLEGPQYSAPYAFYLVPGAPPPPSGCTGAIGVEAPELDVPPVLPDVGSYLQYRLSGDGTYCPGSPLTFSASPDDLSLDVNVPGLGGSLTWNTGNEPPWVPNFPPPWTVHQSTPTGSTIQSLAPKPVPGGVEWILETTASLDLPSQVEVNLNEDAVVGLRSSPPVDAQSAALAPAVQRMDALVWPGRMTQMIGNLQPSAGISQIIHNNWLTVVALMGISLLQQIAPEAPLAPLMLNHTHATTRLSMSHLAGATTPSGDVNDVNTALTTRFGPLAIQATLGTLTLCRSAASAYSDVCYSGTGFTPNGPVLLVVGLPNGNDTLYTATRADAAGNIQGTFTLPDPSTIQLGTNLVTAVDDTSQIAAVQAISSGLTTSPAITMAGALLPVVADTTPPTTTVTVSGTLGLNGWYVSPAVTVTASAVDDLSGVRATYMSVDGQAPITGSTVTLHDGSHIIQYYSVDRVGNIEPTHTLTVNVDSVPPVVTCTVSGPHNASGIFLGPVGLHCSAADPAPGSGVDHIEVSTDGEATWNQLDASGTIALTANTSTPMRVLARASDRAGNISQPLDSGPISEQHLAIFGAPTSGTGVQISYGTSISVSGDVQSNCGLTLSANTTLSMTPTLRSVCGGATIANNVGLSLPPLATGGPVLPSLTCAPASSYQTQATQVVAGPLTITGDQPLHGIIYVQGDITIYGLQTDGPLTLVSTGSITDWSTNPNPGSSVMMLSAADSGYGAALVAGDNVTLNSTNETIQGHICAGGTVYDNSTGLRLQGSLVGLGGVILNGTTNEAITYNPIVPIITLTVPISGPTGLPTPPAGLASATPTPSATATTQPTATPTSTPVPTQMPPASPTETPAPSQTVLPTPTATAAAGSKILYVRFEGTLAATPGSGAATALVQSAFGHNYDGKPTNYTTYTASGLTGTYNSQEQTGFDLYADAGTASGNCIQVQVLYDWTGDGQVDRTETYHCLALDAVSGWQDYSAAAGLESSTGAWGNLRNGKVTIRVWNALGSSLSQLRTSATVMQGQQSIVRLPFQ